MIKIIADGGKVIEAENTAALKDKIGEIFQADPRSDVTLTYVVTKQPTSRRATPTTSTT